MNYFPVGTNGKIKVDGEEVSLKKLDFSSFGHVTKECDDLTKTFDCGCNAVVYNDEIYVLGGNAGQTGGKDLFIKWNGYSWEQVGTLPGTYFYNGQAVVYNNEIHLLGGSNSYKEHYKWDGNAWTELDPLPYDKNYGGAVVYNGEIHILGCEFYEYARKKHYKWNPSDGWTSVSTLPVEFRDGNVVVYEDEIHMLGGQGNLTGHYKWNPTDGWTSVSTLPYSFYQGQATVCNGYIYIIGGKNTSGGPNYKWNGIGWKSLRPLPNNYSYKGCALAYKNNVHLLGGGDSDSGYKFYNKKHYMLDVKDYVLSVIE